MKKDKALIFDLGNVLVDIHNDQAIANMLPYVDPDFDKKMFTDLIYGAAVPDWSHKMHQQFHHGDITPEEFFEEIKKHIPFKDTLSLEEFCLLWPARFSLKVDVIKILTSLSQYKRYLLSDTNELDATWIGNNFPDLFPNFDRLFFSHEMHVDKYSLDAWKNILEESQLPAEQHVFIDDHAAHVERAKQLGIQGIVFASAEQLKKELQKLSFI